MCKSKVQVVCFPRELVSFVRPRELDCLDTQHVTFSRLIRNARELGGQITIRFCLGAFLKISVINDVCRAGRFFRDTLDDRLAI